MLTAIPIEELVEDIREAWRFAYVVKQGHARPELQVIRRPKYVPCGFVAMLEEQLGAFEKPRAEDWMREVVRGLQDGVQCVSLGHRAAAEASNLGEDEPHTVGRFFARFELRTDAVTDGLLSQDKVVEDVFHVGFNAAGSIFANRVQNRVVR